MKQLLVISFLLLAAGVSHAQSAPPNCGSATKPCWLSPERPAVALSRVPEIAVDALWGTAATADLMLSQRCISAHTCHEGNPLLPANATITGAAVLETGETAGSMWLFHRFRATNPRLAWLIPAANIAVHAIGIWRYTRGR